MISCGEPSGDLYAGALATEIFRLDPSAVITGFGGDRLQAAGASLVGNFSGLSVTGLLEVARVLPRTYATYRRLVNDAATVRPDVFVAIDFPDFNFALARALRKLGVPIVYYISPQLWAWRRGRMKTMRRIADRVLVIFPFEERIYREAGVPVAVGRASAARSGARAGTAGGLPAALGVWIPTGRWSRCCRAAAATSSAPSFRIWPARPSSSAIGSRTCSSSSRARRTSRDLDFAPLSIVGLARGLQAGNQSEASLHRVEGHADDVLAAADVALVASGTVTVQGALHECPMVVVYRLSALTYRLGKPFVHVDTYAMANLVAGRRVVPELIQDAFTPEAVAAEALRVLTDPAHAAHVRERAARSAREARALRARAGAPRKPCSRCALGPHQNL